MVAVCVSDPGDMIVTTSNQKECYDSLADLSKKALAQLWRAKGSPGDHRGGGKVA